MRCHLLQFERCLFIPDVKKKKEKKNKLVIVLSLMKITSEGGATPSSDGGLGETSPLIAR